VGGRGRAGWLRGLGESCEGPGGVEEDKAVSGCGWLCGSWVEVGLDVDLK